MNTSRKHTTGSAATTLIGGIVIILGFLYLLVSLATSGFHSDFDEMTKEAVSSRIKPTGNIVLGDGVPAGQRSGELVFNKVCIQCHAEDSTVANSPKFNHPDQWGPRIAKGYDTLLDHAINGFMNDTMPARGGRSDLTDDEVARAVAYMANSAGANFTAPAIVEEGEEGAAEGETAEAAEAAPQE
ncbi:cytochrome c5 family protein [Neisseriaceae bacterium CLB008]|nr:cytochrome c5 family protein [Neisseriaceae bacterium]